MVSLPLVISKKDNSPIQKDLRRNRERELYLTIYIYIYFTFIIIFPCDHVSGCTVRPKHDEMSSFLLYNRLCIRREDIRGYQGQQTISST